MTSMIERVARIIDPTAFVFGQEAEGRRPAVYERARAVIECMREATDEMADVGMEYTGDPCHAADVKRAWTAMINEALK